MDSKSSHNTFLNTRMMNILIEAKLIFGAAFIACSYYLVPLDGDMELIK